MDDRHSRQSWLEAGLSQLAARGADGLSIVAVARELGVTKGSFYWHFRDLKDYRGALLQQWEAQYTQLAIERMEADGGSALDKLRRMLSLPAAGAERLGLALRSWALSDKEVARTLKRVDARRTAYLAGLYTQLGLDAARARTLAQFTYHALNGRFLLGDMVPAAAQLDLLLTLLTAPNDEAVAETAV
ncbi:TetR/AcrR family transcriptional regulator [Bradyrhizobium sp. U531]|uniref:TetR/AcrR family transcriptional regulator n=1 Tax=Bradyrhizobium sp. U531 TaxID=3053458 RepID=UPI003F4424CE